MRDKVKRAYLQRQGQRSQQQPQPDLNDILWLMEQEQEAKQLRKPRHGIRKIIQVLRKIDV